MSDLSWVPWAVAGWIAFSALALWRFPASRRNPETGLSERTTHRIEIHIHHHYHEQPRPTLPLPREEPHGVPPVIVEGTVVPRENR